MDSGEDSVHLLLAVNPVALGLGTEKDNATILRKLFQYKSVCIAKDMYVTVIIIVSETKVAEYYNTFTHLVI